MPLLIQTGSCRGVSRLLIVARCGGELEPPPKRVFHFGRPSFATHQNGAHGTTIQIQNQTTGLPPVNANQTAPSTHISTATLMSAAPTIKCLLCSSDALVIDVRFLSCGCLACKECELAVTACSPPQCTHCTQHVDERRTTAMKPCSPCRYTGRSLGDYITVFRAVAAATKSSSAIMEQLLAQQDEFLSQALALTVAQLEELVVKRLRDIDVLHSEAHKKMRKPAGMCAAEFLDKMDSFVAPWLRRVRDDAKMKYEAAVSGRKRQMLEKQTADHLARKKSYEKQLDSLVVHVGQLESVATALETTGLSDGSAVLALLEAGHRSLHVLVSPQPNQVH